MQDTKKSRRWGCSGWLLLAGFAVLSFSGWARLVVSAREWYWLERFGVEPGPAYLIASGALWGLAGLAALVWTWLRLPGYPAVGMAAALFLAATYWLDRLAFSRPDGVWVNLPFALAATALGLAYAFWILRPVALWRKQRTQRHA